MKDIIVGVVALFLGLIVVVALSFGLLWGGSLLRLWTLPWVKFDSKVNMNQQVIQKTYNADNAIYNYHWFQERQASIIALGEQITTADNAVRDFEANLPPMRKDWTFEDKTENSRLRSIAQSLRTESSSQTQEYNARASEADRSIFQNGLPLFINLN